MTCRCTVEGNWCSRFYGGRNGCVGDSYVTKGPEKYVGNSNGLECVQDPDSDAPNPWFCVRKGDSPPSAWECDKSQCLEKGEPDDDCCAKPSEASCGKGFRYIQGDACYKNGYFKYCCRPEENTTTATSTTAPASADIGGGEAGSAIQPAPTTSTTVPATADIGREETALAMRRRFCLIGFVGTVLILLP